MARALYHGSRHSCLRGSGVLGNQVLHQINPQFLQPQVHLRQPIAPQSYANNTYFNQPASAPQPGLLQQPVVMEADQDVTVDLGGLVLSDE